MSHRTLFPALTEHEEEMAVRVQKNEKNRIHRLIKKVEAGDYKTVLDLGYELARYKLLEYDCSPVFSSYIDEKMEQDIMGLLSKEAKEHGNLTASRYLLDIAGANHERKTTGTYRQCYKDHLALAKSQNESAFSDSSSSESSSESSSDDEHSPTLAKNQPRVDQGYEADDDASDKEVQVKLAKIRRRLNYFGNKQAVNKSDSAPSVIPRSHQKSRFR
jgi:hypothetical protein